MRDLLYFVQLGLEAAVGVIGVRPYEEPKYEVVDTLAAGVEVRRYAERLAAEVTLPESGREGRNRAFQVLFDYIAGANRAPGAAEKIAMTVPVEVGDGGTRIAVTAPAHSGPAEAARMRFFLPSKYSAASAPTPIDPRVRLVQVPGETVAVLRFSGSPAPEDIAAQRKALLDGLDGTRWQPAGDPVTFFYDSPFTLPALRRNEAAVAVAPR